MKKMLIKNKIILLLSIALIIAGCITLIIAGFEKSIEYKAGTRIEVYIPQGYEKQDIINIANESFADKEFIFQEVEKLNQVASIKIIDYTEEELNNFKSSISKKYDIKEEELEIHEILIPTTKISTVVNEYVFPIILVSVLSLTYLLLRNIKSENKWKFILKIILVLILVLGVYFSLILVLRLPFGIYTMPFALAIYISVLIFLARK